MPATCPQCAQINPDNSAFCVRCGFKMQQTNQYSPTAISTSMPTGAPQNATGPGSMSPASNFAPPSGPAYAPPSGPGSGYAPTSGPGSMPSAGPSYMPQGNASTSNPVQSGIPTGSAQSYPAYDSYQSVGGTQWSPLAQPPPPPGPSIGGVQGLGSLRRAFAGYGSLVTHFSWLLPGDYAQAGALHALVRERIQQRNIGQLEIRSTKLTERGIGTEEREYLVVHRGVSTEFVYIAPAGQDLYISRATTALPPVSMVRIIIYSLLALLMIIGFAWHPSSAASSFQVDVGAILTSVFLGLASVVILVYFSIVLVRSIINWLVENDFWMFLRPPVLNDFQLDDVVLLEHVADDVIRQSVKELSLDPAKIVAPPLWYQPKRKIRGMEFIFT